MKLRKLDEIHYSDTVVFDLLCSNAQLSENGTDLEKLGIYIRRDFDNNELQKQHDRQRTSCEPAQSYLMYWF